MVGSHNSKKKKETIEYLFTILAIAQFFVITIITMFFYPGGTREDPTTVGYSFFENMFSDLGMAKAYTGESNLLSMWLFSISTVLVGLSLISFAVAFDNTLRPTNKYKKMGRTVLILGIIAGIGYVGVGCTPKDLSWARIPHFIFQYIAFLALLVMSVLYAIIILKTELLANAFAYIHLGCAILQFLYLLILYHIIPVNLMVDVTAQKIIVYCQLLNFLIQACGGLKKTA
ncbi:MAG: DUF998 domain-containing protein [Promethearchaeota archaeon]